MSKKHMKGKHLYGHTGNLQATGFYLDGLTLTRRGWAQHNKKKHLAGGVAVFKSKSGKILYVRYTRSGRMTEITSDEDEENEDDDDKGGKDTNKFGKRVLKSVKNKIKKALEKFRNSPKKFQEALKNSLTMKDVKARSLREFMIKSNPFDLFDKAKETWENLHGKMLSDVGSGKLYNFVKEVQKTIENKKGYLGLSTKLEEDTDFLDADDLISLILV